MDKYERVFIICIAIILVLGAIVGYKAINEHYKTIREGYGHGWHKIGD